MEKGARENSPPADVRGNDTLKEADAGSDNDSDQSDLLGDYTIDLGGLGEKPSSVAVEDREVERDEMPSEDDGPEDFTINLEKWMRGDEMSQKPENDPEKMTDLQEPDANGCENEQREQYAGDLGNESLFEPSAASTPAPREQSFDEEHDELSVQQKPPIARSNTQLQEQAAEEVFDRISALQAEVEMMRNEHELRMQAHKDLEEENERLAKENEDISRQLKQRNSEDLPTTDGTIKTLESELVSAQGTIDALRAEIECSRQNQHNVISDLKKEILDHKDATEAERNKCLTLAHEAAKLAESRQHNERTIQHMKDDAAATTTELDSTHEQLQETRRILEDVEDENERLSQENARQSQVLTGLDEQLRTRATELQAAHALIAELRTKSLQAEGHYPGDSQAEAALRRVSDVQQEHEAAISALKAKHTEETETLRSALQKVNQGTQKRRAALEKSHNETVAKLQQEITSLKEQITQDTSSSPSTSSVEEELRSAIRVLSNKLEKAMAATKAARKETEAADQRADSIKQGNEIINAELEARFAEVVETREMEWMRRANLLFRERDKMGKALLQGWGREEQGPAAGKERQAYRYKYVKGRF